MKKIKVMTIFGTRPEAIKVAPVLMELERQKKYFSSFIVVTAQHREMLDQVLNLFRLKPHNDLDIMEVNQSLATITEKTLKGLEKIFKRQRPDIVLVQGDTTTSFASALSAFYHKIPVGHIEAGLRTSDIYNPFPEEMNRRLVSVTSSIHFAPTAWAYNNLIRCGINKKIIYLTGNTVTDALFYVLGNYKKKEFLSDSKCRIIFVEAHRRENIGKPLEEICDALKKITRQFKQIEIIFSVHKNPKVRKIVFNKLKGIKQIHLLEPLSYHDLIKIIGRSYLVLTDSGGIQEEAPSMGKPVLVLRKTTERPEGIKAGCAKLVGTGAGNIFSQTKILLEDAAVYRKMSAAQNPYGDGRASGRIARAILHYFGILNTRPKKFMPGSRK